ncbi:MAG TPA: hypothetical protein VLF39_00480 [Candidatus Saccharimonadales bacterium]|nr:hypothetical protein [Candidatus Saccharimonadales bacterium]
MTISGFEPKQRLLLVLAEQLKMPLLQIARSAELEQFGEVATTADVALKLIDSYILSIMPHQTELALEPVSAAAVLQDVAHELSKFANQYDCKLKLDISGKYQPVMANRQNLMSAYTMLGYSFIEAQSVDDQTPTIVLAAHKSGQGLVAGVFSEQADLSGDMYRRAKALYGTTRQPLTSLSSVAGAGVFIADSLMQAMATPLHPSHHHKLSGLAATLLPSQQLQFYVS